MIARRWVWLLVNFLIFEIGWAVCVLGGSLWALVYTSLALSVHFFLYPSHALDRIGLLVALLIGLLHDNLLAAAGVLFFPDYFSPFWLTCLWLLMSITFNHSLQWIYSRPLFAATLGAVAGPIAYGAGILLSDVNWGLPPWQGILMMALVWLWILPLHRWLTQRGYALWSRWYGKPV